MCEKAQCLFSQLDQVPKHLDILEIEAVRHADDRPSPVFAPDLHVCNFLQAKHLSNSNTLGNKTYPISVDIEILCYPLFFSSGLSLDAELWDLVFNLFGLSITLQAF